jgi:hypothetical protein
MIRVKKANQLKPAVMARARSASHIDIPTVILARTE